MTGEGPTRREECVRRIEQLERKIPLTHLKKLSVGEKAWDFVFKLGILATVAVVSWMSALNAQVEQNRDDIKTVDTRVKHIEQFNTLKRTTLEQAINRIETKVDRQASVTEDIRNRVTKLETKLETSLERR